MASKRAQAPDVPTGSKKPCHQHVYCCPNPRCNKTYKSIGGLNIHFGKAPQCLVFALAYYKGSTKSSLTISQVDRSAAVLLYPWDDDDNEDNSMAPEIDEAVDGNLVDDNSFADLPNCLDSVYTESAHEAALRFGSRFTTKQYHETKLLKLLSDANAPHFLYQNITQWGRAAQRDRYDFHPSCSTRNAQIKSLEKWLHMQNSRPRQLPTTLPGPVEQVIQTTCFNFTNQLYSLVSDRVLFGSLENLDVNTEDPFGKYVTTNGLLSTTNSGLWYHNAYKHEVQNPATDFLMPIIMACDETHLRKGGKTSSWPLLFTTSILNQKMRNLPIAWRTLGYINDLSLIQSAAENQRYSKELKAERLHAIFKTVLASLIEAQQAGALDNIPLQFGDVTKNVNLKVPVIFIIGDMQGGDKICCTTCHYSNKLNRLCRKCNVRGDESGDPLVNCMRISMVKMIKFVNDNRQDVLDRFNQYNVYNAWYDVSYGGCKFGIFSAACPIEPLHSLENGIILDCLRILFNDEITGVLKQAELDRLVRRLTLLPRQRLASAGSQPDMPRLLWKDGVTSLTDLSAAYKVGIMFTITVVSLQEDGVSYFTRVLGSLQRLNEMRQVFQMLLSYWVWLKRDTYWKAGDKVAKEAARNSIRVMLRDLIRMWPRVRGQGWEKAKIHEQLHVPDDIERNGAPQGSHTGPTEHNHIRLVKRPAKGTQQRAEVFDRQLGQRVSDSYIIDMAYQRMTTTIDMPLPPVNESLVDSGELAHQGSKEWVSIEIQASQPAQLYFDSSTRQDHFSAEMIDFLKSHYGAFPPVMCDAPEPGGEPSLPRVRLGTEYKRAGTIFRGHANYRHAGPWYDWVMLRWAREDHTIYATPVSCQAGYGDDATIAADHLYAPGQILGFVESPNGDGVRAVVATCDFSHSQGSVFSTKWKRSYVYHTGNPKAAHISLVDVNAIVRHCLMVPDDESQSSYHEIWCRELWGNEFNDCSLH